MRSMLGAGAACPGATGCEPAPPECSAKNCEITCSLPLSNICKSSLVNPPIAFPFESRTTTRTGTSFASIFNVFPGGFCPLCASMELLHESKGRSEGAASSARREAPRIAIEPRTARKTLFKLSHHACGILPLKRHPRGLCLCHAVHRRTNDDVG